MLLVFFFFFCNINEQLDGFLLLLCSCFEFYACFHESIYLCKLSFPWIYLFVKFYSILQQGFHLDLYFCCFLFSLFTKKFPQSSLQRVSDDGRTETCRNTCIKYRRTRESWKICFTWAIFFFSTRFRYWRKNCMRYELLVVNHASGLRRSHGSRKDWLNSTKNIFTSVLTIILEITKE